MQRPIKASVKPIKPLDIKKINANVTWLQNLMLLKAQNMFINNSFTRNIII